MLKTIRISTNDLRVGMFVSALDRSWLDTPFIIQGFRIEGQTQIEKLREYCSYVFIDALQSQQSGERFKRKSGGSHKMPLEHIFHDRHLEQYGDKSNFTEEKPHAEAALELLVGDVCEIFERVGNGGKIDVIQLKKSVEPLIGSISRNPDACLWISRLKQHDEYSYHHALSSAIWAVSLGRELGFSRQDLRSLAMGGMLMDVGKLRIDADLLKADRPLNNSEAAQVREHVGHGLKIIQDSGIINPDITSMVAYHHERHDGSGYPFGMKADEIPPTARIAAIVDTYGAITSNRGYAAAISPSNAIRVLYEARNIEFQRELVEAFIRAIGVYPAGTLVELSSGEVAIVIAEYRTRRLRPKVMVLMDKDKQRLRNPPLRDLQEIYLAGKHQMTSIVRSLEPGAYGIDISELGLEDASIRA